MGKVSFNAILEQFAEQGEKTGWTYIHIPEAIALQLKPGNKKSFRVKGKLDAYAIKQVALIPMGGGDFIMAINATMRKGIGKRKGAMIQVQLEADNSAIQLSGEFLECLADEPDARSFFDTLAQGHRNYFSKWIESAKTEPTKTKRIAMAINALARQMDFGAMLREAKEEKKKML